MRIAFGTDDVTDTTEHVVTWLREHGHDVDVVAAGEPWTDVGRDVGEAVASGRAERGVVACWTGTGVSMAANKVPGARAALCTDAATAAGARQWNDANVLAFGLRLTTPTVAEELLEAFLSTDVAAGEHLTIAGLEGRGPRRTGRRDDGTERPTAPQGTVRVDRPDDGIPTIAT